MIYQFNRFELDVARFELREEGAAQPLEPQVFNVLAYLIEHRERLVPKNELFEKLWYGRIVTDSTLTSRIKLARQALGDSGKAQKFIKTIHGKGFRFVAEVHTVRTEIRSKTFTSLDIQFPIYEAASARQISILPPCLRQQQSVEISMSMQHDYMRPGHNWR